MKESTQQIQTATEQIKSQDLSEVSRRVSENSWATEYEEYTLTEALGDLDYLLHLLLSVINKDIIDNLSREKRSHILQNLNLIYESVKRIHENQDHINPFLQGISQLKNIIREQNIDFEETKFPSYSIKRREINELIKKYTDAINAFQKVYEIEKKLTTHLEKAQTIKQGIDETLISAKNSLEMMKTMEGEIQAKKIELEAKHIQATEHTTQINSIKDEIEKFQGGIEDNKMTLANLLTESNEIIHKHTELQDEIEKLLQKSLGNNLFSAFKIRADELQKQMKWWITGIVISFGVIIILGVWLSFEFKSNGINDLFVFKLFLTAPAVYSVFFFTRQFGHDRKLQEEYAFKSTISLSIVPFREELLKIAQQNDGREANLEITKNTMEKVFQSPLENISKNPIKDKEDIVSLDKLIELLKSWKPN